MSIKELKLTTPLKVNGIERKVLTYDVDELTINHITKAEAYKAKMTGSPVNNSVAHTDFPLHFCIGMQAVMILNPEISEEDLMRLKRYDVVQLSAIGTSFFVPQAESSQENNFEKPQEDMQDTTIVQ